MKPIKPAQIDALMPFRGKFEEAGFSAGDWNVEEGHLPWFNFDEIVMEFIQVLYDNDSMKSSHNVLLTQAQRKVVADLLPKYADRLKLDEKNPRTIPFTPKELESIRDKAIAARPHAENGMKRNSLRHVVDAVTKAIEESEGVGSIPVSERLYQFKITLLESKPQIW